MAPELAVIRSPAEEAILARYPAFKARQAHWGGARVVRLRDAAFDLLKSRGLPNRRVEEWKYTDLRALMRDLAERFEDFTDDLVRQAEALAPSVPVADATRILFVNGRNVTRVKPEGFEVRTLAEGGEFAPSVMAALARERDYSDNAAVALNTAFMDDTIVLRVPEDTILKKPIHLAFREIGDKPFSTFPRVLVVVEEGAFATIIETHDGPDGVAYQTHALVEIEAGTGAKVEHVRINAAGDQALALSTLGVHLADGVEFSTFGLTTGAAASRHQIFAAFDGEHIKASIRGSTLLRGKQHADTTMVIDHRKPHGESRELFKSVLDGESRGVFQGRINVHPGAQKTDGKMAAHALLLSEDAEVDVKPELEIFADDVVCGHGATSGALDDELLFYLKARGIPQNEAEALMVQAFVGEAIEPVTDDALRDAITAAVEKWLKARM